MVKKKSTRRVNMIVRIETTVTRYTIVVYLIT